MLATAEHSRQCSAVSLCRSRSRGAIEPSGKFVTLGEMTRSFGRVRSGVLEVLDKVVRVGTEAAPSR